MPRASTIRTSKYREQIELAISQGVPNIEIARRYAVSPSSVSRAKRSASDVLTQVLDDDGPTPTDVLGLVADLVESATRSRKIADASGSAAIRARAQGTELAALNVLIDRLGIDDLNTVRAAQASGYLVRTITALVEDHAPELLPEAVRALRAQHQDFDELADALANHMNRKTQ